MELKHSKFSGQGNETKYRIIAGATQIGWAQRKGPDFKLFEFAPVAGTGFDLQGTTAPTMRDLLLNVKAQIEGVAQTEGVGEVVSMPAAARVSRPAATQSRVSLENSDLEKKSPEEFDRWLEEEFDFGVKG